MATQTLTTMVDDIDGSTGYVRVSRLIIASGRRESSIRGLVSARFARG
jgi:hypothetical protein